MAFDALGGIIGSNLISAVIGIFVGIFIHAPLQRTVDRRRDFRKEEKRVRGLKDLKSSLAIDDKTIQIAGEEIYILEFSPQGFRENNIVTKQLAHRVSPEEMVSTIRVDLLPLEPKLIVAKIADRVLSLENGVQSEWNGRKPALENILVTRTKDSEESVVELSFGESDYATFDVISRLMKETHSKLAGRLSMTDLREVQPGLSHSFGLNATLKTADGKLLLTKRDRRASSNREFRHIAINEGLDFKDSHVNGTPDLYMGTVRGAYEELGIVCSPKNVAIHSLILDVSRYQWAALGHVDLSGSEITSDYIRHQRTFGRAKDDWETSSLEFIECSPEAVINALSEGSQWISHGWVNLFLTGLFLWPAQAESTSKEIMKRFAVT